MSLNLSLDLHRVRRGATHCEPIYRRTWVGIANVALSSAEIIVIKFAAHLRGAIQGNIFG
jgi:hypothetical protein